jgi:hypothetical protein
MANPQTAQNIKSSANRAESATALLQLTAPPSAPPAIAVAIPIRAPPMAAAEHRREIGREEYVGADLGYAHRAIVDKARQPAAKTVLKSSEGWKFPASHA